VPKKEAFDRPYVSKYNPNDRFMITVATDEEHPDHGVVFAEYQTSKWKSEIYVSEVDRDGAFHHTGKYCC
jgi:hypothetical protein